MTWNILGAGSQGVAGFNRAHRTDSLTRTVAAARLVERQRVDLVGFQEVDSVVAGRVHGVGRRQFDVLRGHLPSYSSWPRAVHGTPRTGDLQWMSPIYWRTDRFSLLDAGRLMYPFQDAPHLEPRTAASWVRLRGAGFEDLVVLDIRLTPWNDNAHCRWPCNPPGTPGGSDRGGAQKRERAAQLDRAQVRRWRTAGTQVVVLGDLNSRFVKRSGASAWRDRAVPRSGLPYCVLTAPVNGAPLLQNAYDRARHRSGHCPSHAVDFDHGAGVDHLYLSPGVLAASGPAVLRLRPIGRISDHWPLTMTIRPRATPYR